MVELGDRPQQADIAFLNQVEEVDAAPHVALGDADDQPQVGARQRFGGKLGFALDFVKAILQRFERVGVLVQPLVEQFLRRQRPVFLDVVASDRDLLAERDQVDAVNHVEQAARQFRPRFIAPPLALTQVFADRGTPLTSQSSVSD